MNDTAYYQKNKDVILNRAKDYYETIKKDWESLQKINVESSLKKIRIKKKNMEKTDIIICLKKRNKNSKNIKKFIARQKSLNIIMNKIVF